MKRILLTSLLALNFVNPAAASDDLQENVRKVKCTDCQKLSLPRHEACATRAYFVMEGTRIEKEKAEKARLKVERREQAKREEAKRAEALREAAQREEVRLREDVNLPTQREYLEAQGKLYLEALLPFVSRLKKDMNLPVPEILRPRTIVYVPCSDGMLSYNFNGITSEKYTSLQEFILESLRSATKGLNPNTLPTSKVMKSKIFEFFMQNNLPGLEKDYSLRMDALKQAKERGLEVAFADGMHYVVSNFENLGESLFSIWLIDRLSDTYKVDSTTLAIIKAGFENPTFIRVRDAKALQVANMRGVSKE